MHCEGSGQWQRAVASIHDSCMHCNKRKLETCINGKKNCIVRFGQTGSNEKDKLLATMVYQ